MNNEWFMTLHKTDISFVWTDTIDLYFDLMWFTGFITH